MNKATVSRTIPRAHQNSTENELAASSTIKSGFAVLFCEIKRIININRAYLTFEDHTTFDPDTMVQIIIPSVIIKTDTYLEGS